MTAHEVRDLLRRLLESYDNCDVPARGGAVTLQEVGDRFLRELHLVDQFMKPQSRTKKAARAKD